MTYDQSAFKTLEAEESMLISRGGKGEDETGVEFWIRSHRLNDWSDRESHLPFYLGAAEFKSVSEKKFNSIVSKCCAELSFSIELPLHTPKIFGNGGRFVGALVMYEQWDVIDIFAEYENEYLHVYWDTTA